MENKIKKGRKKQFHGKTIKNNLLKKKETGKIYRTIKTY
jgi:hypothetical protein